MARGGLGFASFGLTLGLRDVWAVHRVVHELDDVVRLEERGEVVECQSETRIEDFERRVRSLVFGQ